MGHRIGAGRLDDVKMQVIVDPDNTASASNQVAPPAADTHPPLISHDPDEFGDHHDTVDERRVDNDDPHHHHQRPPRRGTKRKLEPEVDQSAPASPHGSGNRCDPPTTVQDDRTDRLHADEPMDTLETGPVQPEVDGAEVDLYAAHRHSVFQLSVCKLSRFRHSADPSLRRSVLICNTLRSIEREMLGEGVAVDPDQVAAACFPALLPDDDDLTLDPPPMEPRGPPPNSSPPLALQQPEVEPVPLPACTSGNYERGLLTDLDWPSGRETPHPAGSDATDAGEIDHSRGALYPEQLRRSERLRDVEDEVEPSADQRSFSWSSVLNLSSQGAECCPEEMWLCEDEDMMEGGARAALVGHGGGGGGGGGPNTSPSSSSDSGISTASDEIFGDVDLSLYDFDLIPLTLLPGNVAAAASLAAGSARPPATSPSAEELLRNCSFAYSADGVARDDDDHEMEVSAARAPSLRRPTALQQSHRNQSSPQPSPSEPAQSSDEADQPMHPQPRPPAD